MTLKPRIVVGIGVEEARGEVLHRMDSLIYLFHAGMDQSNALKIPLMRAASFGCFAVAAQSPNSASSCKQCSCCGANSAQHASTRSLPVTHCTQMQLCSENLHYHPAPVLGSGNPLPELAPSSPSLPGLQATTCSSRALA